ncbi:efflux RND transporter permease subunit [Millionella massiliensis]|uniref:efflux RND transporter permease subunit n=1 Tax=Millionella massiliensis TaxID=1871023 RepID=UPI0008DAD2AE|nr:efflux RND transporter permease subunit [Millionella massiliensis]
MIRKLIERPIAATMCTIAVIVLGIVASRMLPISLMPEVDIPQITVRINAPNVSARELQASVIAPLRSQLMQTSHLHEITAQAKDGSGIIFLQFDYGTDIDYIFIDVNERIDRAMGSLPKEIERPTVVKASATDIPAFYLNLTLADNEANRALSERARENRLIEMSNFAASVIAKRLEQLPQVAFVDLSGRLYPELAILPDMARLEALGIEPSQLQTAIEANHINMGNLTVRDGQYQYNIRFNSTLDGRRDIEQVPLNIEGRLYRLNELADVVERPQQRQGTVLSDDREAISMAVIKQSDARMGDLKREIGRLVDNLRNDYPEIDFTLTRDQTQLLDYSIGNLESNLIVGAILACLVIFLFMQDFRAPLLITLTIPLSLLVSLLFFFILGISINIISLSGLMLGLGMMVDNSIIVIDNISQRWDRGQTMKESVIAGTGEVFSALLSSVLTTCSIFIPLIFLSGIAGAMFYDQAMAVSIGLVSSLIVAMTIIPVYYHLLYRNQTHRGRNRILQKIGVRDMAGAYERSLLWVFRHQRTVLALVIGFTAAGVFFYYELDKTTMPPIDKEDVILHVDWNQPITNAENTRRSRQLIAALGPAVTHSTLMAGQQQFVLSHTTETSGNEALTYIRVSHPDSLAPVVDRAQRFLQRSYPDAAFRTEEAGNIFEMIFADKNAMLTARLRPTTGSAEPDKLNPLLSALRDSLRGTEIEPVVWQEHITLYANQELMSLYRVSYNTLYSALKSAFNQNQIMEINQGQYSLPVSLGTEERTIRQILSTLTILSDDQVEIPVDRLLTESPDRDLRNIVSGAEGEYYPLNLDIADRQVPTTMATIRNAVEQNPDFEVSFSGSWFDSRDTLRQLILVLSVSLLLLYFILASQFESLVQPLIIMSEIVVDISGALLILWLCGSGINLMSLIGLVVMSGIVINDSILKVDTFNRLRKEGYSPLRAVLTGGDRRLKPIIMTSLTTILAIVPFLFSGGMGNDLQRPLSLAIIGGMIFGTLVSVYFIPIFYYHIYRKRPGKNR